MRLKLIQFLVLATLVGGIVVPVALTQGPGGFGGFGGMGRGGRGDRGGRGMRGGGADMAFAMMAGKDKDGKPRDVIIVSEYEAPVWSREPTAKVREKLTAFLTKRGITNGQMTKEVFAAYNEEQQAERSKMFAKSMFERLDTKKTGKLSKEDIEASARASGRPSSLAADFGTHDKNKDGFIDEAEYGDYMKSRMSRWGGGRGGSPGGDKGEKKEEKRATYIAPTRQDRSKELEGRPLVFRYGKLPTKELPSWFVELDTDKDGQVGLYEWIAAKRSRSEFKDYDLNRDGFVAPEEVLMVQRRQDGIKEANALTYIRVNADPGSPDAFTGTPTSSSSASDRSSDKGGNDRGSKGRRSKGDRFKGWGEKGGGKSSRFKGWGDKGGGDFGGRSKGKGGKRWGGF